jgi:hypothetical protein
MSSSDPDRDPERLIDGKFGNLLREANREFATELDQPAAFRRVTERLAASRKQREPWAWLLPATLFAIAAIAAVIVIARPWRSDPAPELVAERARGYYASRKADASAAPSTAPLRSDELPIRTTDSKNTARSTKRSADPTSSRAPASVKPEPEVSAKPLELPPEPPSTLRVATEPARSVDEGAKAPDCLSLARQGQTRQAEACFLKRAEGSGLGAEMALYEVSRLRRDVLADADGALRALAEYRKRFPAGSLRREADMSQLELLRQLGRSDDALKQSEELLLSSASGERAAELHLLRGHILRKAQSRFAAAAREYELAENAGARGGEATYFRALCLQALGRGAEAATLFAQYLKLPQRPYAEDAKRRLETLNP